MIAESPHRHRLTVARGLSRALLAGAAAALGACLILPGGAANAVGLSAQVVDRSTSAQASTAKVKHCTGIEKKKGVSAAQVIEVKQRSKTSADIYLCRKSDARYVRDAGPLKSPTSASTEPARTSARATERRRKACSGCGRASAPAPTRGSSL